MYANQIKEIVWRSALRMDPQPGTYQPRVSSSGGPGTTDTFDSYPLERVTYRPPTLQELNILEAALEDKVAVFTIYQKDLELAGPLGTPIVSIAPAPEVSDMLAFNVGVPAFDGSWTIERTTSDNLHSFYTCVCREAH